MTLVISQNVVGRPVAAPLTLDRRRRRLSTIARRHGDAARPFLVSVHRRGAALSPCDDTVRLRKAWASTLIGPDDTVLITYLPRGGGSSGGSAGKAIGGALAMIALAVIAPYAIGAIGAAGASFLGSVGSLTLAGKVLAAGIIAGGAYLISKATQAKAQKTDNRPVYGVSGGGNLARAGDRIPRGYGHFWTQPDLTQPDYITNDGEDQVLYKRMTIGLGRYRVLQIQVGGATLWTEAGGVQPPFVGAEVEIVQPGTTSSLVPETVISAQGVTGQELPRPDDNPVVAGPYPMTPVDLTTALVQIDYTLPQGVYSQFTNSKGSVTGPMPWGVLFEYAICDEDNQPIGPWQTLLSDGAYQQSSRALRFTRFVAVDPAHRYVVRGRNTVEDDTEVNQRLSTIVNTVQWDGLRAHLQDAIVRPHVTEIALKVRSGKSLGITAFADCYVEANAIIPVWSGASWVEIETRKAVWAYCDILRGQCGGIVYGGNVPDDQIDRNRPIQYAAQLGENDTFDGVIRGPVSVYEAASTVLGVLRAEPQRIGNGWTLTRDEPRAARKHVFTRRQIVKDSTTSTFKLALSDGAADVVVEYNTDSDPRRRREVRVFFGAQTVTPRRYKLEGISSFAHAHQHATWLAASAYFRRETRKITTEYEGRLVQRNDPCRVDAWFITDARAAGVIGRDGATLILDTDVVVGASTYAILRDRAGEEWGPLRVTAGETANVIVLNADDIATIASFTGVPFADVFTADDQEMTSLLVGTLVDIEGQSYLVAAVEPQGRDRVAVTALVDHPGVWTALGEPLPPEPAVPGVEDLVGPAVPQVPWVRASAIQHSTAVAMDWSIGLARNAASYVVDLSYDNWASSERVSEGAATSGNYAIRGVEGLLVKLRARAISAAGVVGPSRETSFYTFKPTISDQFAQLILDIEDMSEQLQKDIESASSLAAGTIRSALKGLADRVEALAAAAASEAGNSFESRDLIKVALDGRIATAFAAIERETTLRIGETTALAQEMATFTAQIGAAMAAIGSETTARLDAVGALALRLDTLQATVGGNTAAIVAEAQARATADGARASSIQALTTTVGGHTATLAQQASSIDGIEAQYGVVITIDQQTGGFILSGVRKLDGSIAFAFRLSADLLVDGTITARKLVVGEAIIGTAQIFNEAVATAKIAGNAVTNNARAATSGTSCTAYLYARAGSRVTVIAAVRGGAGATGVRLRVNGGVILSDAAGTSVVGGRVSSRNDADGNVDLVLDYATAPSTFLCDFVAPYEGVQTITLEVDNTQTLSLLTIELAR